MEVEQKVLAVVEGQPLTSLPNDLFIPPDALEILLDSFNGPLDLLLYLIKQQNFDILNIPIVLITEQYMQYIQIMKKRCLELAADYLVMAALLGEIKSRMLLPIISNPGEEIEEDPRLELVRRLQAYEEMKEAATKLDELPRYEREIFQAQISSNHLQLAVALPDVELSSLTDAFTALLQKQKHLVSHQVYKESLSVRERMTFILEKIRTTSILELKTLYTANEGRMGLVVTVLAILELAKQSLLTIIQTAVFSPVHIQGDHDV